MTFGISATTAALIAGGTVAAATVYSADKQRSAANKQRSALLQSQEADARQRVEAQTGAALAANASLAASKRRRKASSLLTGGGTPSLGGAGSLLGASPDLNQGPQ